MSKNQKIGGARYIGLALGIIATLGLILTLESGTARANIFPNDAITISQEVNQSTTSTLISGTTPKTILYFYDTHTTGDFLDTLNCGGVPIVKYTTKTSANQANTFLNYVCPDTISYTNGGTADKDQIILIYVNYNLTLVPNYQITLASVSFPSEPLLSQSASPLTTYGTMTAGDILIALLLFGLIMLSLLTIFLKKI